MSINNLSPVFSKPILPATLKLTIKKEYFDLIKIGKKTEEYRENKTYWQSRLLYRIAPFVIREKKFKYIEFRNGYSKNAETIIAECKGISLGKPKQHGSILFKDEVFIISIGEIVWSSLGKEKRIQEAYKQFYNPKIHHYSINGWMSLHEIDEKTLGEMIDEINLEFREHTFRPKSLTGIEKIN